MDVFCSFFLFLSTKNLSCFLLQKQNQPLMALNSSPSSLSLSVSHASTPLATSDDLAVYKSRYHYVIPSEEAKQKWEHEEPKESYYESYYDTDETELLHRGIVVIYRRRKRREWVVKSDCSFVDGGIQYTRRNFLTKEATEQFLKMTLAKEPFCQLRIA